MSQLRTKPTMTTGTATRKAVSTAWLKALMTKVRWAGGRCSICAGIGRQVRPADQLELGCGGVQFELGDQSVGEDGTEHSHAEGSPDGPEERRGRRRHPQRRVRHRVLHRDDQDLHDQADPQSRDEHEDRHLPVRGVRAETGEQEEAQGQDARAQDRKILYRPILVTSQQLKMNVTSMPPTRGGSNSRPAAVGVAPWTVWRSEGQVHDRPEHREADDEPHPGTGDREGPVPEQDKQEDQRLGCSWSRPGRR